MLLKEGLRHAPSLVILVIIVIAFLRYLNLKDKRDQEDFDKRDVTIKGIASQQFEIHRESNKVIKENTQILGEVKHTLEMNMRNRGPS